MDIYQVNNSVEIGRQAAHRCGRTVVFARSSAQANMLKEEEKMF